MKLSIRGLSKKRAAMMLQYGKLLYAVLLLAFGAVAPAWPEDLPPRDIEPRRPWRCEDAPGIGRICLPPCDVDQLRRLSSLDLSDCEKTQTEFFGESTEGATAEYYYSAGVLKAIKSVYYGETGKVEWEYYFHSPSTYTARVTDYDYSLPIYLDRSDIVAVTQTSFSVCQGELIHGVGNEDVTAQFNRASGVLETLMSKAPENSPGRKSLPVETQ